MKKKTVHTQHSQNTNNHKDFIKSIISKKKLKLN